jgi:nucleoid DNA-binding protein
MENHSSVSCAFSLTLLHAAFTLKPELASLLPTLPYGGGVGGVCFGREYRPVTKKEIVKQISDDLELTQLKVKDIVQKTFDAIVDTLLREGRIELRNFGVFEVKRRKARKARNPRTGDPVDVEPKNVVTFKPGKEMEEKVRNMKVVEPKSDLEQDEELQQSNGTEEDGGNVVTKSPRTRKMS